MVKRPATLVLAGLIALVAAGSAEAQCPPTGDPDGDGIPSDGDASGVAGDAPCETGQASGCDDNCCLTANPGQEDLDWDGQGDACDPCVVPFGVPTNMDLPVTGTRTLDACDTNGDGRGDVIVGRGDFGALRYLGNGRGALTLERLHPRVGNLIDAALGQLDLDPFKNIDLATLEAGDDRLWVYFGTPEADFTDCPADPDPSDPTSYDAGTGPRAIAAADLDNDGATDLAVGTGGPSQILLRFNDGLGGFNAFTTIGPVAATPLGVALFDFDGDGLKDVAAVIPGSPQQLCLSRNLSNRQFSACSIVASFLVTEGFLTPALDAGDFNHDGRGDIAAGVTTGATRLVILFYQRRNRTFVRVPTLNVPGLRDLSTIDAGDDAVDDLALLRAPVGLPELIGIHVNSHRDADGDGFCDAVDNCPGAANAAQTDDDADTLGNPCDNCPLANTTQIDIDGDGLGDLGAGDGCDADDDDDGNPDLEDNCATTWNPAQQNFDAAFVPPGDSLGDACDNCPVVGNESQLDGDQDGTGNACENCLDFANPCQEDPDNDGIGNPCDNCPFANNPGQEDSDGDGPGDACDADADDDGVPDDGDGSGVRGDNPCQSGVTTGCDDNCPTVANPAQTDFDRDGMGDVCDDCTDVDQDGLGNPGYPSNTCVDDNCPFAPNPGQEDLNGCEDLSGAGDRCECGCRSTSTCRPSEDADLCEPLWVHGPTGGDPHRNRIDVVFVRDDSYAYAPDPTREFVEFKRAVWDLIENGLNRNPQLKNHTDPADPNFGDFNLTRYNFYAATDLAGDGDASSLLGPIPRLGIGQCGWRDVTVVVHQITGRRDRSGTLGLSTPDPDLSGNRNRNLGTLIHELGHAAFDLMDEYGYDGGYYPFNNNYCRLEGCLIALADDPNGAGQSCVEFCPYNLADPIAYAVCIALTELLCPADHLAALGPFGTRDGFWKYDPDTEFGTMPTCIMDSSSAPNTAFGPDCIERIDRVHARFDQSAAP